mmetsp:Transcript_11105/g.24466  ORF Transcript_11105/g.24466 Transcript_11105/m.24466 type:complete len:128 (+) Transcript_11105:74-457(+)
MCVVVGGVEVEVAPMWFCDATRLDGGAPQYRRRCFRVGMARSAAWTNERGSSTTPPYHAVASFGGSGTPISLHVKDSTTICNTTLPGNMILGQTRRFIPGGGEHGKVQVIVMHSVYLKYTVSRPTGE